MPIKPDNEFFEQQWYLKLIETPEAWDILASNGQNAYGNPKIIVGVIDSGVQTRNGRVEHQGFKGKVSDGLPKARLFIDDEDDIYLSHNDDSEGIHGTAVTGLITAKARKLNPDNTIKVHYEGNGIAGVAPNIKFIAGNTNNEFTVLGLLFYLSGLTDIGLKIASPKYIKHMNLGIDRISLLLVMIKRLRTKEFQDFINTNQIEYNQASSIINLSQAKIRNSEARNEKDRFLVFDPPNLDDFFLYLMSFSREGRGVIFNIGAGNSNIDVQENQPLAQYDYPLVVGATAIHDDYYESNSSTIPEQKASYSSTGSQLDIVAPGGGSSGNYARRKLYSTTIHNCGEFYADSPLKLTVKGVNSAHTILELDNIQGVFKGQHVSIGNRKDENEFEIRYITNVNKNGRKITLNSALYYTKNKLTLNKSKVSIAPLFTRLVQDTNDDDIIYVESNRGFAKDQDIYIGSLGDGKSGNHTEIKKIEAITIGGQTVYKVTLKDKITQNVTDDIYVIPQPPSSSIKTVVSGSSCQLYSTEGLFVGGQLSVSGFNSTLRIAALEGNKVTFSNFHTLSGLRDNGKTVQSIGFGNFSSNFTGTSGACPIVSGVVALMLSVKPTLNVLEVKDILARNSDQVDSNHPSWTDLPDKVFAGQTIKFSNLYGYGRVNAKRTVQVAKDYDHGHRKLRIRDAIDNNSLTINSPDIWVRPGSDIPRSIKQESGFNRHIQPILKRDLTLNQPQTIHIRVINEGTHLPSIPGGYVRCLLAFTNVDHPNFEFPNQWYQDFEEGQDKNIIWLGDVKMDSPILPNDGNIDNGDYTTWNEKIFQINWDTKSPNLDWKKINPRGFNAYILVHIAPFDGEVSLTNMRENKQLTYKRIAPLYAWFRDDTDQHLEPSTSIEVPFNGVTINLPFKTKIFGVNHQKINETYLKCTLKKTDGSIDEVVRFKHDAGQWEYETQGAPDWILIQNSPIKQDIHIDGYYNLEFECGLFASNQYSKITVEVVDKYPFVQSHLVSPFEST